MKGIKIPYLIGGIIISVPIIAGILSGIIKNIEILKDNFIINEVLFGLIIFSIPLILIGLFIILFTTFFHILKNSKTSKVTLLFIILIILIIMFYITGTLYCSSSEISC